MNLGRAGEPLWLGRGITYTLTVLCFVTSSLPLDIPL